MLLFLFYCGEGMFQTATVLGVSDLGCSWFEDYIDAEVLVYFCTRGQAEREFKVEVEAIGRVRHKNLVRLLGYCVEGAYRY